jgi:hypothetical protein
MLYDKFALRSLTHEASSNMMSDTPLYLDSLR